MNLSAVLLAGGESRRMGRDKATLLFRERPLGVQQLELLRRLRPRELFVSARIDPPWRPCDVRFVPDDPPSRGPLSGVAASVAKISTGHLLVLAVDTPFITETYLRQLCGQIAPGRGVLPTLHNRAEPLIAVYPKQAQAELAASLDRNQLSLQSLARRLVENGRMRVVDVNPAEEGLFRNLNEPRDLLAEN